MNFFLQSPANPWRPSRPSSAFSLTEVVIAMGVAAVAFTSIIGLFPLGLNMSKESYEETQAALLAQTIMADLRDLMTGGVGITGRMLQAKEENTPYDTNNYITINTSNYPGTVNTAYVAYDQKSRTKDTLYGDIMLRPFLATNSGSPNWYDKGTNGAFAIAKITWVPTFVLGTNSSGNPQRVDVSVETPGNLPVEKRTQFLFTGGIAP